MDTLNGKDIKECTKGEALEFCYKHKDDYIRQFYSIDEGMRQFDCLIEILESDTIPVTDLPDYGMSDNEL